MLTQRQIMILEILKKNNNISDAALSCLLKISQRTILREISDLNILLSIDHVAWIDNRRNEGYYLIIHDYELFQKLMDDYEDDEYAILLLLCLHHDIALDKIAEQLFLSRPSALKRLNEIREKYHDTFSVKATNKGYHLSERIEVRTLLLSNIIEQKGIDYLYDKQYITKPYHHWYYALYDDMKHLVDVIHENHKSSVYLSACIIADAVYKEFHSFQECLSFILKRIQDYIRKHKKQVTIDLIEETIVRMSHTFPKSNYNELVYALYMHILRTISYPQFIKFDTTYIEDMQISYPFSYDLTIRFIEQLHRKLNFSLHIDSNLLLLYFILEFEKENTYSVKFYIYANASPICEMNKRMLHESFANCEVIITDNIHLLYHLHNTIIINAYDTNTFPHCHVIYVTQLLSNRDIEHIQELLRNLYALPSLLKKEYAITLDNSTSKLECMTQICIALIKRGWIGGLEANAILQRENMDASLCIGNVWIPHCISHSEGVHCYYISLLHPMMVNGDEIRHVIIVIVNHDFKQSKLLFTSIYNYIIYNYSSIKDATTFDTFIQQ